MDDIFDMIVGYEKKYLLKDKHDTNIMEENKNHLNMTWCSVFKYFVDNNSCPLHIDKLSFQNFPFYLLMNVEE